MGDPACFLAATCLDCGRFLDDVVAACPHCGAQGVTEIEKLPCDDQG